MCAKVAGTTLEITRQDLENGNYAPFMDALYEALDGVLDVGPVDEPSKPMLPPEPVAPDLILDDPDQL